MLVGAFLCACLAHHRCVVPVCWVWMDLTRFHQSILRRQVLGQLLPHCQYFIDSRFFLAGGHEDFSKMIDEAEPLGYPVVVKSTRGHRGQWCFWEARPGSCSSGHRDAMHTQSVFCH